MATTKEEREAVAGLMRELWSTERVDEWVASGACDAAGIGHVEMDGGLAVKAYRAGAAAALTDVLPLERVSGRWGLSGEGEPTAVVTYTSEPSPETGHVGWVWWANGKMGEAKSLKEAMAAADASEATNG